MTQQADVVVIGAGIGGLTAAHALRKQGRSVTVLEASDHVGGRIVRMSRNQDVVEAGAQGLHSNYDVMLGLVFDMGLSHELGPSDGPMTTLDRGGAPRAVHGNGDLLRLLSPRGRIDLMRYAAQYYLFRRRIPQFEIVRDIPAYDNVIAADALSWASRDFYDYILRPQTHAQCGVDPEYVNIYHLVNMLMIQLGTKAVGLRSGIVSLCERIADGLDVHFGAQAERVLTSAGRVDGVQLADGRAIRARHVILACPINAAAQIVPDDFGPAHAYLSNVSHSPLPLVFFFLDRPLPTSSYAFFAHAFQPGAVYNMALDHMRKMPAMVPSGKSIISAWPAYPGGAEMIGKSDADIIARALKDVEPMIPGISGMVEEVRIQRHKWGFARYGVGAHRRLLDFKEYASTLHGLSFVGNDYDGVHMESAARSGLRAARRAMAEG